MSQLEELKGLQRAILAMGLAMDDIINQMSQMEEGSGMEMTGHGVYKQWRK